MTFSLDSFMWTFIPKYSPSTDELPDSMRSWASSGVKDAHMLIN